MTAVNPMQPTAPPARDQRGYEPSMEEILASIRRIIADDQFLPGRGTGPETHIVSEPAPQPEAPALPDVHVLHPADDMAESAPPVRAAVEHPIVADATPLRQEPEASIEPPIFAAHGTIAPQYATPAGPVAQDGQEPTPPPREELETAGAAKRNIVESDDAEHDTVPRHSTSQAMDKPLGRHEPIPFAPISSEPNPVEPASLVSPSTDQAMVAAFNMLAASRLTNNTDELLAMTREMIRPLLKTWLDDNLPSMVERLVRAEIERAARGGR